MTFSHKEKNRALFALVILGYIMVITLYAIGFKYLHSHTITLILLLLPLPFFFYYISIMKRQNASNHELNETLKEELSAHEDMAEALKESERYFRSLVTHIPGAAYRCDYRRDYMMHFISDAIKEITGYPASDFIDNKVRSFGSIIHPDDLERILEIGEKNLKAGSSYTIEYRIIDSEEKIRWIYDSGQGILGKDGKLLFLQGTLFDISDRKKSETDLLESREKTELALEGGKLGMWFWEKESNKITLDDRAVQILGFKPATYDDWYRYIHPDDIEKVRAIDDAAEDPDSGITTYEYEYRVILKPGDIRWISDHGQRVNWSKTGKIVHAGTVIDITHKKKAVEEALEYKEKIELALKGGNLGMWYWNSETDEVTLDERAKEILGFIPATNSEWNKHIHSDDVKRAKIIDNVVSISHEDFPVYEYEYRVIPESGKTKWIFDRGQVVDWNSTGKPVHAGTILDVTNVKQAEEELHKLQKFLSNILDAMPSIIVGVDKKGNITHWNQKAEIATRIPAEIAEKKPFANVFPEMAGEMDRIQKAIQTRQVQENLKVISEVGGQKKFSDITIYPLTAKGMHGAVIRIDDVTERVRLEEMMIQSEKMLSVGGLAAGMAHEINNPLAGIIQNIQVIKNRLSLDLPKNMAVAESCGISMESIEKYMDRRELFVMMEAVMNSGKRAAQIIENMLLFSRKGGLDNKIHDISKLLDATVELAENDYDLKKKFDFRQIKILREYEPGTPEISCEGSELQQVFFNILKNGAHAMVEDIQKVSTVEKKPTFTLRVTSDHDMVRVEIQDNGPGMNDETRKRIFEPFFTTKGVGLGTGLGMSVSYFIIVEHHGGTMAVESLPGQGATFIIRLPIGLDRNR